MSNENNLKLEDAPIVRDNLDIFLDYLLGLPPEREIKFSIDLVLKLASISKASYRMVPMELNELKY